MANTTNTTTTPDGAIRGLGRQAYRDGVRAADAPAYAAKALGRDLLARERALAADGWGSERDSVLHG